MKSMQIVVLFFLHGVSLCHSNLYSILGVQNNASFKEIRSAYRKLAILYHPDKNPKPNATKKFMEISNSYKILSHAVLRKKYDSEDSDILSFLKGQIFSENVSLENLFSSYFKEAYTITENERENQNESEKLNDMIRQFNSLNIIQEHYDKKERLLKIKKLVREQSIFAEATSNKCKNERKLCGSSYS